jgi:hypothetical protein
LQDNCSRSATSRSWAPGCVGDRQARILIVASRDVPTVIVDEVVGFRRFASGGLATTRPP